MINSAITRVEKITWNKPAGAVITIMAARLVDCLFFVNITSQTGARYQITSGGLVIIKTALELVDPPPIEFNTGVLIPAGASVISSGGDGASGTAYFLELE